MGHYPSPQIHKGLCTLARTSFILPGRHYPPTGYEGIISAEPEGSAPLMPQRYKIYLNLRKEKGLSPTTPHIPNWKLISNFASNKTIKTSKYNVRNNQTHSIRLIGTIHSARTYAQAHCREQPVADGIEPLRNSSWIRNKDGGTSLRRQRSGHLDIPCRRQFPKRQALRAL